MIVIITDIHDGLIHEVVSSFEAHIKPIVYINEKSRLDFMFSINEEKDSITVDKKTFKVKDVEVIWLRNINFLRVMSENEFQRNELMYFFKLLNFRYKEKFIFNGFDSIEFNKLVALEKLQSKNIFIPDYFICNTKTSILEYMKWESFVVKPISQVPRKDTNQSMFVKRFFREEISLFPDIFLQSLIQEYILPQIEIRVVFIKNDFFAIASITRADNIRNVDIRKDQGKHSHYFKYQLEPTIKKNIIWFLESLRLNYCTLDIIIDKKDKVFLLDINPFGSFGSVYNYYKQDINNCFFNNLYYE
ncbi:hypothetical protein CW751_14740 [Brumimicrobium salinarum]|uniref:Grasp-with-spasm system ATP-grasp peptide maturase n=1 Tax=Brumimicrobium salinarum TaxID=2058658 RepID=A0A2I0QYX2_9FLAO|nr:hypothetical protein [Brumimicrobium salinarum]PKR79521.1 hypothetical protein CW751_14740 [Brumimicrobium salinarum]